MILIHQTYCNLLFKLHHMWEPLPNSMWMEQTGEFENLNWLEKLIFVLIHREKYFVESQFPSGHHGYQCWTWQWCVAIQEIKKPLRHFTEYLDSPIKQWDMRMCHKAQLSPAVLLTNTSRKVETRAQKPISSLSVVTISVTGRQLKNVIRRPSPQPLSRWIVVKLCCSASWTIKQAWFCNLFAVNCVFPSGLIIFVYLIDGLLCNTEYFTSSSWTFKVAQ